jgi:serine/threonine-protein kinase
MSNAESEPEGLTLLDQVGVRFEEAWKKGPRPKIEDHLGAAPPGPPRDALFRHLLGIEVEKRSGLGEAPAPAEYERRFPHYRHLIQKAFELPASSPPASGYAAAVPAQEADALLPPSDDLLRFSDFEVGTEIGAGGMGTVFRARQKSLGREVAVKVLKQGPQANRRFWQEARLLARLRHDNIVHVYGLGLTDGRGYFLAMEFVDGPNLDEWVKGRGRIPIGEAVRVVTQVVKAVR